MKKFFSPLMAILSIVSPICIVGIMCMIETEIIEAVISGLVLGCMVGSVFSIIFWVTNKYKNKIFISYETIFDKKNASNVKIWLIIK